MAGPRIFTYSDAIENLIEFASARGQQISQRALRGAIRMAYVEVPSLCNWPTLTRTGRVYIQAPQSTGTIVYDHSGGDNERQLTLTGATWPTWCIDAVVRFDDTISHIATRESSTVVTLDSVMNPGEDVASTTYNLFKQWYNLPENFGDLTGPIEVDTGDTLQSITLTEMLKKYRQSYSAGDPQYYTVTEVPDLYGTIGMYLYPVKTASGTLDYVGRRLPRQLQHTGYDSRDRAGTISVTADSATVTGSGTSFKNNMVGSIIRIGDDTENRPTSLNGEYPYTEERSIISVDSTTLLTLDNTIVTTSSGKKYTISCPIDLGVSLHNLFMRQCEKHLARNVGFKDIDQVEQTEYDARILAMGTRAHSAPESMSNNFNGPIGNEVSSFD